MPNLYFWDATFVLAPYTLLGVGLFTFLISLYGILIQGSDKRKWFAIFAILVTIAFIGQLGSTYFLWQVKTLVSLGAVGGSQVIQSAVPQNASQLRLARILYRRCSCG